MLGWYAVAGDALVGLGLDDEAVPDPTEQVAVTRSPLYVRSSTGGRATYWKGVTT